MHSLIRRLQSLLIAGTALALSAGLVFGATPPAASTGLANAAANAGKTVPVAGGQAPSLGEDEDTDEDEEVGEDEDTDADEDIGEDVGEDEDLDEDLDEDVESAADGENCTDPSLLLPEELDALKHGSIVCWAAQQTEWPVWFANHGAFVRCWAHQGKADAASCTVDPTAEAPTSEEPTVEEPTADATKAAHGKGHGKAKGKFKHGA
jgi:hypothetical protein